MSHICFIGLKSSFRSGEKYCEVYNGLFDAISYTISYIVFKDVLGLTLTPIVVPVLLGLFIVHCYLRFHVVAC
jgi:hypothetical protein